MRKFMTAIFVAAISLSALLGLSCWTVVYGPGTLVPPPDWPFTADSRSQYDPLGDCSVKNTRDWFNRRFGI